VDEGGQCRAMPCAENIEIGQWNPSGESGIREGDCVWRADTRDTEALERVFGGRWIGIRLGGEVAGISPATHTSRLCELVGKAPSTPQLLLPSSCCCPGAQYALGWRAEVAETIAAELHARIGLSVGAARDLLETVPRLMQPPQAVVVGESAGADVYVSFAQPLSAMKLIRRWHAVHGGMLRAELSSVMAVCSAAILGAFLYGRPAVTFGCPESRNAGGLSRDRLVLAVPGLLVGSLARG